MTEIMFIIIFFDKAYEVPPKMQERKFRTEDSVYKNFILKEHTVHLQF